jgi:thiamine biosynthesis lipoprotein
MRYRHAFAAMGCPCEFVLEGDDESQAQSAARAAEAEVRRLDAKYSHYRDDSLIGDFARAAEAGASLQVDEETAHLLDFADALHRQSAGRFDVSAGALIRLWDPQRGVVPGAAEVAAAKARCGWDKVAWRRPHLRFDVPGLRLDFGGVVKEYAADRAAALCRGHGLRHGVVDLGGDLAVIGAHADGSAWRVGIKAPRAPGQAAAEVALARGALATSGDYERVMIVEGRRYSHILDARDGRPVESFASVSVIADTCLVAGAASTLAMLFGRERGAQWLAELGLPYLTIDAQGRLGGSIQASPRQPHADTPPPRAARP